MVNRDGRSDHQLGQPPESARVYYGQQVLVSKERGAWALDTGQSWRLRQQEVQPCNGHINILMPSSDVTQGG